MFFSATVSRRHEEQGRKSPWRFATERCNIERRETLQFQNSMPAVVSKKVF